MPGIFMSATTTRQLPQRTFCRASSALVVPVTGKPAAWSLSDVTSAWYGSSSNMQIGRFLRDSSTSDLSSRTFIIHTQGKEGARAEQQVIFLTILIMSRAADFST